jgi:hypothetical protein
MKAFNVEAEYHMLLEKIGAHRVKVKILDPDLAMYINGMVVFTPDGDKHPDWTVYTPKAGNARIVEFAKSSTLWKEIQEACIDAVKLEQSYKGMDKVDDMGKYEKMSDDEFNNDLKIDLDKIFPD